VSEISATPIKFYPITIKDKPHGELIMSTKPSDEVAEIWHDLVFLIGLLAVISGGILATEHVIAATGYRADIRRLPFLSAGIISQLKLFNNVPKLSSHFESSVPGLLFVGPAAVDSFGPVLRFACGAKFTASRLSNYLARTSRLTMR
jgi:hypothetical protein